jgi:endonuclease/exonuclease/phosphatase family metal-dependent hydrolase
MERQRQIARLATKYAPTIFCLQEFWFDDDIRALYRQELSDMYRMLSLKRPGQRQDGLLLAYNPKHVTLQKQKLVTHDDAGRVSLLAHFKLNLPQAPVTDVVIANTHLNFPHSPADEPMRVQQALELMEAVTDFQREQKVDNVLLLGDFNGTLDSEPCLYIQQYVIQSAGLQCYRSTMSTR